MSQWNWSWVSAQNSTLKSSNSVDQSGGTIYAYRAATRGQLKASELSTSIDSISANINQQWTLWRVYLRPVIDSLPAGIRDQRWRPGTGLPEKIDALRFGIQGTTLFVCNDMAASTADGRYWDTATERPKTIAEALEDLWNEISNIETTSTTSSTSTDTVALWAAIGNRYQNSSLVSSASSLDRRTNVLEEYLSQLSNDIYGVDEGFTYSFGMPLLYSLAKNVDELLKIHDVTGWQSNPADVNHDALVGALPPFTYSQIAPFLSVNTSQGRVGPYSTLENEILRIRYEIAEAKGTTYYYQSATDPVTSVAGNLATHMGYVGSGAQTSSNPHGLTYVDVGQETINTVIRSFTGMTNNTDSAPTYTSTNYITNGNSLEVAIGKLDSALYSFVGTGPVTRWEADYDRSSMTEEERRETPILVTHNRQKYPLVQVLDITSSIENYYGQYVAPTYDMNVVHLSEDEFEVWTDAEVVKIIALF